MEKFTNGVSHHNFTHWNIYSWCQGANFFWRPACHELVICPVISVTEKCTFRFHYPLSYILMMAGGQLLTGLSLTSYLSGHLWPRINIPIDDITSILQTEIYTMMVGGQLLTGLSLTSYLSGHFWPRSNIPMNPLPQFDYRVIYSVFLPAWH